MAALPYIQLYVSDYLADTAHLTAAQHGAYLLLIFNYWQRGQALSNASERLANVARMSNAEWLDNKAALAEFFVIDGDSWSHPRIDADLAAVAAKSTKNAANGKLGAANRAASAKRTPSERPAKAQQSPSHTEADTEAEAEAEKKQVKAVASRLPDNWQPADADLAFCRTERPDLSPQSTADRFRDYWSAQPGAKGRKVDWHATWRNWVRNERALPASQRPVVGGLGVAGQSTAAAAQRWLGGAP